MNNRHTIKKKIQKLLENRLRATRQEIEEKNQEQLKNALTYAATYSPLYKSEVYQNAIFGTIQKNMPFNNIPFTTKNELRQNYPYGLLATSQDKLIRYGESTGSTGTPTAAYMTYSDWIKCAVWMEWSFTNHFSSNDMIFIAIPYELAFASYDLDRSFEEIGATIVAVGALNNVCPWPRVAQMMDKIHPSTIVCAPSRALRLYDLIKEQGIDPKSIGLNKIFYVGETCSENRLNKIKKKWNCELVTGYGSTETCSLALFCKNKQLHLCEDRHYFEVVDIVTGEVLPLGQRGELVVTTLESEAMPLVRYKTGDYVLLEENTCSCGLNHRVIKHYGRLSEFIHIDNQSIPRIDLEDLIMSIDNISPYYAMSDDNNQLTVAICHDDVEKPDELDKFMIDIISWHIPAINFPPLNSIDNPDVLKSIVHDAIYEKYNIDANVIYTNKDNIIKQMDKMLKPGTVKLTDIMEN